MQGNMMVNTLFVIFVGAAIFSTLALYTRQSLLVAYMILGIVIGPWGLGLISSENIIEKTGDFGIIFLLFLLGLHLQPRNLLHMLNKALLVTMASALVFAAVGFGVGALFHFTFTENLILAAAMMFSSTIIGLRLLPTTVLHHQHTGEIVISILLLQDLLAIIVLVAMHAATFGQINLLRLGMIFLSLPVLLVCTFGFQHYLLAKLFMRFDRIREYIFLLAIAWCLGISVLAKQMGLTYEIGAFIAGVSIAEGPIALYIAESLKPVRDFFLVLFFFSMGAGFDWHYLDEVFFPAFLLAGSLMFLKPWIFQWLLRRTGEPADIAAEVGWRLGQVSEFSLLIGYIAHLTGLINITVSYLIQATTILTFMASSYIVVMRYPTPVALTDKLRRD